MKKLTLLASLLAITIIPARAALVISEVNPGGSSASYGADWFELTNTGALSLDITGWKMDDSSAASGMAVALRGITSIGAGESVIFTEGNSTGSTDATIWANFETAWFGSSVPASFKIGGYGGSGVGLSTGGDGIAIFDGGGTLMAKVSFGSATTNFTFDNTAGLNNATISTLSAIGVNGAFLSNNGVEVGSPGVTPVPEPSTWITGAALVAFTGVLAVRRRRAAAQI